MRITDDIDRAKELQKGHGGWNERMRDVSRHSQCPINTLVEHGVCLERCVRY